MKTFKEILTETANEHSYESWYELMYDSHVHWQIYCTKLAFIKYLEQCPKDYFCKEIIDLLRNESD
jgi:hypothetical protein